MPGLLSERAYGWDITFDRAMHALRLDIARGVTGDTYGMRFHDAWRRSDRGERMVYRFFHRKPESWMPPGYPPFWD